MAICQASLSNYSTLLILHVQLLKEYSGDNPADLYLDMRENQILQAAKDKRKQQLAVPGIINPHDRPDEMQE